MTRGALALLLFKILQHTEWLADIFQLVVPILAIDVLLDRCIDFRLVALVGCRPRNPTIRCSDLEDSAVRVNVLLALYEIFFEA